jgi:CrcB protein
MDRLAWVCLGGAIGSGARYLVTLATVNLWGAAFPWGTLVVNVVGSFLISFIMHVAIETTLIPPLVRIFLTTGIMGGLTTYSTFNFETLGFAAEGDWPRAAANLLATVVACLVAGVLGVASGRALVGNFGGT